MVISVYQRPNIVFQQPPCAFYLVGGAPAAAAAAAWSWASVAGPCSCPAWNTAPLRPNQPCYCRSAVSSRTLFSSVQERLRGHALYRFPACSAARRALASFCSRPQLARHGGQWNTAGWRGLDDDRRNHDQQFIVLPRQRFGLEQFAEQRKCPQQRNLLDGLVQALVEQPADGKLWPACNSTSVSTRLTARPALRSPAPQADVSPARSFGATSSRMVPRGVTTAGSLCARRTGGTPPVMVPIPPLPALQNRVRNSPRRGRPPACR